jgi:NAD(P)-dependent dehydrogenase (short-subunit alcohol dehydrogenase family)
LFKIKIDMWITKNIPDQTGKTIIVTGGNAGIGYETVKALYQAGALVIMASRDLGKAQKAADSIKTADGKGRLETAELDLEDLDSIKNFASKFTLTHNKLDVLINNAGVMIPPLSHTPDGFEQQFGVNFIGHFALTGSLYSILKATHGARVVNVSSMAYLHGTINFDNLKAEKDYDAMREYCQSKLANILFALELQRRIETKADPILSLSVQPGANKTELSRHMSEDSYKAAIERVGELMEPWQGALPSLYAATMPDAKAGVIYSPDQDGGYRGYPAPFALAPNALDATTAARLYDFAANVTGIQFPA